MPRFVTAAFGAPYLVAARGLLRSFQVFAPSEDLTIFTDMPDRLISPNTIAMSFADALANLDDFYREADRQRQNVFRFGILRRMQEIYPNDDICWIDADMLVLCNLSEYFRSGYINVMSHGRRDNEVFDCGGGLLVPGKRYAIGGMYSLPPGAALDYITRTMRSLPSWPDEGGPLRHMADQIILNHLVARSGLPVAWISDNEQLIFNLEVSDSMHPVVGDRGLAQIRLEDNKLLRGDRQIAVFCWIKKKLDAHLRQKFSTFQPEVAGLLKELYLGAPR